MSRERVAAVARRGLDRLVDLQVRRPTIVLVVSAVLTALSVAFALRLPLHAGFEYLLPQSRPSVRELHRVSERTAGVSTLFIVLHADGGTSSEAQTALRRVGDDLTVRLRKLGSPWVGSVEDGVQDAYRFLAPRAGLYADMGELERLRSDLDTRFDYEVGKATGSLLDDQPPPPIDAESIKKRLGLEGSGTDRYPDGYYQSKDGHVLVVAIRSKILGTDLTAGREAIRRVREVVDGAGLATSFPPIHYGLQGDLWTGVAELTIVNEDLTRVGLTGIALIGAVCFFYFLRVRALAAMLFTILVGVSWTFCFTYFAVGFLNLATGFLFTIIAGNGINAGVILCLRR